MYMDYRTERKEYCPPPTHTHTQITTAGSIGDQRETTKIRGKTIYNYIGELSPKTNEEMKEEEGLRMV